MDFLKIILSPLALLYGIAVACRNWLYDSKLWASLEFEIPVIAIGNLSTGGTGKSPMVEYLIRLIGQHYPVCTLSRGYGRKTSGFRMVDKNDTVHEVGDEPLLFKQKYPQIGVAVCENRALAIPTILQNYPAKAILMDDAFQHRGVLPGLNILLTDHNHPFTRDHLLPSGRLREWRHGYKRAHVIIVTKCPPGLSKEEQDQLRKEIKPQPHQTLFFSTIEYGPIHALGNPRNQLTLDQQTSVLLLCGIANPMPLIHRLKESTGHLEVMSFDDHHNYDDADIAELKYRFEQLQGDKKLVLTTEKDAVRLLPFVNYFKEHQLTIYIQPIRVKFLEDSERLFHQRIFNFLLKNPALNPQIIHTKRQS